MTYGGTVEEQRAKSAAAARRWREKPENLEKSREASRKAIADRRARDPEFAESQRQAAAKWRAMHPEELPKYQEGRNYREANLKRFYGLSLADYDALLQAQNGVCAICSEPPSGTGRNTKVLHVDHDHATGKVRGLLCHQCNVALASFERVANFSERVTAYLDSHRT